MKKLLAKGFKGTEDNCVTLRSHTKDVVKCVEHLMNSPSAKYVIENRDEVGIKLSEKDMLRVLKLSAFLHDLGKVSPAFQRRLGNEAARSYCFEFWESFPGVRHNVFSLFFVNRKGVLEVCEGDENVARVVLSAIALHHWKKDEREYLLHTNGELVEACKILLLKKNGKTVGEHFADVLREHLEGLEGELLDGGCVDDFVAFDEQLALHVVSDGSLTSLIIPPHCVSYFLPKRVEFEVERGVNFTLWVFLLGFLVRADHFASFVESEGKREGSVWIKLEDVEKSPKRMNVVEVLERKFGRERAWQIDVVKRCIDENVVLIAPTGVGKTEFALAWGDGSKLFFTLPFRSATNQIFERTRDYCAGGKGIEVGLLHSDADLYLLEESEIARDSTWDGETLAVLDVARQLSLPVNVCTGDQIFPAALKYPVYERVMSALINARLVIDEVQAYDPRACAVVLRTITDAVTVGGKFLLMTATLPGFVRNALREEVGENGFKVIDLYKELPVLSWLVRHRVTLRELDIEENVGEMVKTAEKGKRVLVILNTVEKAEKVCEKLKKEIGDRPIELFLLHARFTLRERRRREEEIGRKFSNPKPAHERQPKILVATQVVEASLDLDADYLFTEVCPVDSLIQRMGRVMRRVDLITGRVKSSGDDFTYESFYRTGEPNVYVFYLEESEGRVVESGKGKVYDVELLKRTVEVLKEREREGILEVVESEKQDLVECVYARLSRGSFYLKKFNEALEVFRSGYAAGSKHEAQKLFREVRTVCLVRDEDVPKIVQKLKKEFEKRKDVSWLWFKKEIVAEHVVNESRGRFKESECLPLADELVAYFDDECVIEKLRRYSRGIWVKAGEEFSNLI